MIKAILGTKINQKQTFNDKGDRVVVTMIKTGPLAVVGIKTIDRDGYSALQLGWGTRRAKTVKKPVLGTLKKVGLDTKPVRFLREVEFETVEGEDLKPGVVLSASQVFKVGDAITVTGTSKGKGFQGGVRRHGFKGGPRTHGQSDRERAPGSIGQTTTPGRVYKGKRMAGRMGNDKITVKNLKVVAIDDAAEMMTIQGLVPGAKNGLLIISKMN
jgi:large subunit ribosomal protein L3